LWYNEANEKPPSEREGDRISGGRSLRDELKQTLVIVTHDETLADRADRAYRMVDGEMYVRR
jgi:predicted ABC-type transport system involved in lysophospholipase L1 biosynthesis ATPase subunit